MANLDPFCLAAFLLSLISYGMNIQPYVILILYGLFIYQFGCWPRFVVTWQCFISIYLKINCLLEWSVEKNIFPLVSSIFVCLFVCFDISGHYSWAVESYIKCVELALFLPLFVAVIHNKHTNKCYVLMLLLTVLTVTIHTISHVAR